LAPPGVEICAPGAVRSPGDGATGGIVVVVDGVVVAFGEDAVRAGRTVNCPGADATEAVTGPKGLGTKPKLPAMRNATNVPATIVTAA
jgi:hypothetical protein